MNTTTAIQEFAPDYACPPGDLLSEYLEELDISARELARRCGRSGKLIAEIAAGRAPIEPETALQLETVLGVSATVWLNMEAAYQLQRAREVEATSLEERAAWADAFPIKELTALGQVPDGDGGSRVKDLLRFFGAGSVKACEDRIDELLVADFRTSDSFSSDRLALATWLRLGEREALAMRTSDYDRDAFVEALKGIRELSTLAIEDALPRLKETCAAAGVAFVLEKPLAKVKASGVSRWLSSKKALIQQSCRHMSDDHFWFTFFHECAHILLHSRKATFIDMEKGPGSAQPKLEAEANAWASDFLVPTTAMRDFVSGFGGTESEVTAFADHLGIAPGIVVGQLQHMRAIPFSKMNRLRQRYEWR